MPSILISPIVPPGATRAAAGVARARRCADAGASHAVITTSAAASTASQRKLTPCGAKPPTPDACASPTRIVSGHKALHKIDDPGVNQIVPGREHHQRQHQREADAEAVLLR